VIKFHYLHFQNLRIASCGNCGGFLQLRVVDCVCGFSKKLRVAESFFQLRAAPVPILPNLV